MKEIMLQISGMSCNGCENTVKRVIAQIKGVHEVSVDFRSGKAVVKFDPLKVSVEQMVEAVEECGYAVKEMGNSAKGGSASGGKE